MPDKEILEALSTQSDALDPDGLGAKLVGDVDASAAARLPDPPKVTLDRPVPPEMMIRMRRGISMSVSEARSMSDGWNIASALTSSLIAGVLVGLAADKWVTTKWAPAGLITGFMLGCLSGFGNLIKLTNRMAEKDALAQKAAVESLQERK